MGDSDDEYDRKRRDKFRGERVEAPQYRGGGPDRGGPRGGRGDEWIERPRDYRVPAARYSPGMDPAPKRMRHDFYATDGYYNHYGPYQQPPHRPGHFYREPPGHNPTNSEGQSPPMMSFKAFLATQDDNISDSDAIEKYNDYKLEFQRQQLNEFFVNHKDEEWFRLKYHPEDSIKRKDEQLSNIKKRVEVFLNLFNANKLNISIDINRTNDLLKLMDTVVIKLEGGTDEDLELLEKEYLEIDEKLKPVIVPIKEPIPTATTPTTTIPDNEMTTETTTDDTTKEDGELKDEQDDEVTTKENGEICEEDGEIATVNNNSKKVPEEDVVEVPKIVEKSPVSEIAPDANDEKKVTIGKKRKRSLSGSSSSNSSSGGSTSSSSGESDDDEMKIKEEKKTDTKSEEQSEEQEGKVESDVAPSIATEQKSIADEEIIKIDEKPTQPPPRRILHRTTSIFLRNLAPTITKQEVEAVCGRYEGFLRVALAEPQMERRWLRRGWVTFKRDSNIKEICWNLNNIRLRDCELGAIVNRDLSRRVRAVNGVTAHKPVVRSDVCVAAKVVLYLDQKAGLWTTPSLATTADETDDEKTNVGMTTLPSFGITSKNPILQNITDFLIEEASAEEDCLLGIMPDSDQQETANCVERDEQLINVLDRMILYLRIVHSVDYYNHCEYPNEDEMPNRCGILHARGPPPISKTDVTQFIGSPVESKMSNFLPEKPRDENKNESKLIQLAKKEPDAEIDKFVQANTRELAKDKWLCPLSGKKFKGPDFVRKHIFNKHVEKIEEVKKEVEFFNNYLRDPKRPMLIDVLQQQSSTKRVGGGAGGGGGGADEHTAQQQPQQSVLGAVQPSQPPPPTYGGHPGGRYGGGFGAYSRMHPYYNNQAGGGYRSRGYAPRARGGGGGGGGPDFRPVIHYRDLDAPREPEEFI